MEHATLWEAVRDKFTVGHDSGCWEWTANLAAGRKPTGPYFKGTKGYGQVHYHNRQLYGHRVLYELLRGPIPEGLTIDHLCCNTTCVNPWHMEPVSIRVNVQRRDNSYQKFIRRVIV